MTVQEDSTGINLPPTVQISGSSTAIVGQSITLTGTVTDEDSGLENQLSWHSDIDQALGTGNSITAVLSEGSHTITASVTDSGGLQGNGNYTIVVDAVDNSIECSTLDFVR